MNETFLKRMKNMLGDEYEAYLNSLNDKPFRGFRINSLKISDKTFFDTFDIPHKESPFALNSYYLLDDKLYGNSLPFALGLMYLQEPSASSAVSALDVKEDDYVLDMCAAPGSKSTQIAQLLSKKGLLVSNEIDNKRAQVLLSNIERLGISNTIITNNDTKDLTKIFESYFDKVLVDAPCSGEGMFKKEEMALTQWSEKYVEQCSARQSEILNNAYMCLKGDGYLVYSTCTYSIEENEKVIFQFLNTHDDMELVKIDVSWGRPGFNYEGKDFSYARRIFPMDNGEGHFICKMHKKSKTDKCSLKEMNSSLSKTTNDFLKENIKDNDLNYYENNGNVYAGYHPFYDLKKLHVIRQQVLIGKVIKDRFEPHQHLYTSTLFKDLLMNYISLDEDECDAFRAGEELNKKINKGYYQIRYLEYPLGFAKSDGSHLKNKYPKGLRYKKRST